MSERDEYGRIVLSDDDKYGTFPCWECGHREYDTFYFSHGLCRDCMRYKKEKRSGEADEGE